MDYLSKGTALVHDAVAADEEGRVADAYQLYMKALSWFELMIKYEKNASLVSNVKQRMFKYVERCEQLAKKIKYPQLDAPSKKAVAASGGGSGDDDEDSKLEKTLESVILMEKPNVSWDDVAGLELAKEALKEAVIVPIKFPQMFNETFTPWKGVLLYGPPGTGKSYLAKAIATEADATFFNVSAADLISKWVGQSERLVKTLFRMARQRKPSIIFIDEVDSLCGARDGGGGGSDSNARVKTQLLLEMQGVGKSETGLLVLGATNLPWSLDIAMRRRFEKKIYIPLPSKHARTRLFQLCVGKSRTTLAKGDFEKLADLTEGYSGADVSILTREAMMASVRKVTNATHFKSINNDKWTPCSPGDEGALEMTWDDVDGASLVQPPTGYREFERSIETIKCTVSADDVVKYDAWTNEFGSNAE
jgi:vacuolar protein-sorting-associated protein 4